MPIIDVLDGIKICIYSGEHRPPHIHAIYNEFDMVIEIESNNIIAGDLPYKKRKKVIEWLTANKEWATLVFYELNPELL